MVIENKYRVYYISFSGDDFEDGTAEDAIKLIKSLPKGSKKYYNKRWIIWKDKIPGDFLIKLKECGYKFQSKSLEEEGDFDIEGYLRSTFGHASIGATYCGKFNLEDHI